ncbi:hypothetical protein CGLO_17641 [Colletotrichum gloeosporioides Cg-14]|uniref:Uncharacterized protein n=1 Tax=Colletotrichum gloeosporioides (strain Cg-14) TaxID=1237896 RepID=T0JKI2_COLGC|nr:hypothetical protein CGLO_17641 [Colletotrichum gloeosporioides Cg-14]
METSMALRT